MSGLFRKGLVGTLVAATLAASALPAAAQFRGRDRDAYIERYYSERGRDRDYDRWRNDRRGWSDNDYRRWYRNRHRDNNNNNAGAAALFGLAAGAIIGGAISQSQQRSGGSIPSAGGYPAGSQGWVSYCSSRYRSFDRSSGTYMGYDGQRHYCQ